VLASPFEQVDRQRVGFPVVAFGGLDYPGEQDVQDLGGDLVGVVEERIEELKQQGLDTGRSLIVGDPEHVLEQVDDYFLAVV